MVDIVMTTYNSGKFLREQLDSILSQLDRDWRLLISDDGSTDGTRDIIAEYTRRFQDKIFDVTAEAPSHNITKNFENALTESTAPYVMFADHDDVWLPEKITVTLELMDKLERNVGATTPCLVHTNLQVVDASLHVVDSSFWHFESLRSSSEFRQLLFQNNVTGCASMVNRSLLTKALPFPEGVIMYDWWIALVSAAFGEIVSTPGTPILYRQHGGNAIGAKRLKGKFYDHGGQPMMLRWGRAQRLTHDRLMRTQTQARAFLKRYSHELSPDIRMTIESYIGLSNKGWVTRRLTSMRYGFFSSSFHNRLVAALFL